MNNPDKYADSVNFVGANDPLLCPNLHEVSRTMTFDIQGEYGMRSFFVLDGFLYQDPEGQPRKREYVQRLEGVEVTDRRLAPPVALGRALIRVVGVCHTCKFNTTYLLDFDGNRLVGMEEVL